VSQATRRQILLSGLGVTATALLGSNASGSGSNLAPLSEAKNDSKFVSRFAQSNSLPEIEALASDLMPPSVYQWISGGAADEITLRWNREAFESIRLQPRILVDVSALDTTTKLLGHDLSFPILLSPTGAHGLVHPEGELATVRGAGDSGAVAVISAASSFPIEEIARNASGPIWAQLFIKPDRKLTRDLVQRCEGAGCRALCVTVDDPITGVRDKIWRAENAAPNFRTVNRTGIASAKYEPSGNKYKTIAPDRLTWDAIGWLRSFARTPILLKGVLNPEDAEIAVQAGASGLIVSNHGARQLDTVSPTIDALPLISEKVAGRIPVLVDGGIRRGTDVLKALALGASAVLIGRPYLYGLAAAGAEGVSRVINILRNELEVAMALTGRPTISSIDRSVLLPTSESRRAHS
jgi:4-hydroxymandelate oxidase